MHYVMKYIGLQNSNNPLRNTLCVLSNYVKGMISFCLTSYKTLFCVFWKYVCFGIFFLRKVEKNERKVPVFLSFERCGRVRIGTHTA